MGLRIMVDFTVLLLLCTQLADIFIRAQEGCTDNVLMENNQKNVKAMRFRNNLPKQACRSWCIRDVTCVSVYAFCWSVVKLLPTNCTKKKVYTLNCDASGPTGTRKVAVQTFRRLWQQLLPLVVTMRPPTN